MSKKSTHIDELLKMHIEKLQTGGSAANKAAFMKKANRFSFFRFYPGRFNIFYLIGAVSLIASIALIIYTSDLKPTPKYKENRSIQIFENTLRSNNDVVIQESTPDKSFKKAQPETNTPYELKNKEQQTPENIFKPEPTQISKENDQIKNSISKPIKSEPIQVVYDTVIKENRILITDTIQHFISDTIKIKKKRKRRHR